MRYLQYEKETNMTEQQIYAVIGAYKAPVYQKNQNSKPVTHGLC